LLAIRKLWLSTKTEPPDERGPPNEPRSRVG
jgi:hypothetical protein